MPSIALLSLAQAISAVAVVVVLILVGMLCLAGAMVARHKVAENGTIDAPIKPPKVGSAAKKPPQEALVVNNIITKE